MLLPERQLEPSALLIRFALTACFYSVESTPLCDDRSFMGGGSALLTSTHTGFREVSHPINELKAREFNRLKRKRRGADVT